MTLITVDPWSYPAPCSITLTAVIEPPDITGVKTAPTPAPVISRSGVEKYLLPEFKTITWTILPLLIIGWSCASTPVSRDIDGWWSKPTISEDPYPTPPFSKWTEVTVPLTIGWTEASKVSDPIDDIPTFPVNVAVIDG